MSFSSEIDSICCIDMLYAMCDLFLVFHAGWLGINLILKLPLFLTESSAWEEEKPWKGSRSRENAMDGGGAMAACCLLAME